MHDAYIAGFIDGEGCIGAFLTASNKLRVLLTISNTYPFVLAQMATTLGVGRICRLRRHNAKSSYKPCYQLVIRHDDAIKVLRRLLPHLVVKKREAELAIFAVENVHRNSPRQQALYAVEISRLKHAHIEV